MSTSKRVIKNTAYLYIRTIASLLLGVFTTRVLLEALGESDFGLYNVVGGSIAMLGFLSASLSSATQRFLNIAEGEGDKNRVRLYFANSIIIHRALSAIMVVIFVGSGFFFFNGILNIPEGKFNDAIIVYACLLISTVFSITIVPYEAEINAHENMLFFSIVGIIDVVLKFAIALAVLYFDSDKLIFYAVLMALESFAIRYLCEIYCRRNYEECRGNNIRGSFDKAVIRQMTSFAGWNLANIATGMISLFGMNIVVNHYFGTNVNAAMGIATQLSGVLMGLSANMIKAVAPVIMKSEGGHRHDKMLEYSYVSCKFSYLIFSVCCIPVLFYIHPILKLWLTEVPEWTPTFCVILIISTLIEQLTVVLYQSIMAGGDIKAYNIFRSVVNILPLLVSILMFQYGNFPPYWALLNWGIYKVFLGGLVNVYFSRLKLQLSLKSFLNKVLKPTITCSAIVCALFVLITYAINPWIVGLIAGTLLSLPIYWSISLSVPERKVVHSFIHK